MAAFTIYVHLFSDLSIRSECSAECRNGEAYHCTSGFRLAERIEPHEVMDCPVETNGSCKDPGFAELVSVSLALIPENVILIDNDQSWWQTLEISDCGLQRGHCDFTALRLVAQVT